MQVKFPAPGHAVYGLSLVCRLNYFSRHTGRVAPPIRRFDGSCIYMNARYPPPSSGTSSRACTDGCPLQSSGGSYWQNGWVWRAPEEGHKCGGVAGIGAVWRVLSVHGSGAGDGIRTHDDQLGKLRRSLRK